ncbi:MAG TPA: hypothetical protein VKE96_12450 [Vicinamibacterales bacterium]|nr:hypothetical protein [Vicinamibacterales bacterium]
MAGFEFQSYVSPYANTIAQLIARQNDPAAQAAQITGNLQARAIEARGEASSDMIRGLSGLGATIAGKVFDTYQNAPKRELEQQQLAKAKLDALDVQEQRDQRATMRGIIRDTPRVNQNGMEYYDLPTISAAASAKGIDPTVAIKNLSDINDSFKEFGAQRQAVITTGAQRIAQAGNDPELALNFLDTLKGNQVVSDATITKFRTAIVEGGQPAVERMTRYFMGPQKAEILPAGATAYDPTTNKPLFTAPEKEAGYTLGPGDIRYDKGNEPVAWGVDKPAPKVDPKEEYLALDTKRRQGLPLTPAETATLASYEHEKLIGPEAAAAEASKRLASSQDFATAQQTRAQNFTEAEAGRHVLTAKADEYSKAQHSAQTLRDVVNAAKYGGDGGNRLAASMQTLLSTITPIRAEGMNRINQTEYGVVERAGSKLDRIEGFLGGWTKGQPVPPNIQQDMLDMADMLENTAYDSYTKQVDYAQQTYPTMGTAPRLDPPVNYKPQPPRGSPPEGTTKTVNGVTRRWGYYKDASGTGQWGWKQQ